MHQCFLLGFYCFFWHSITLPPARRAWGQPEYAPIPRKASKNKEEALVHMDCWCIWFLRDLRENNNHPRGAPRPVVVVFFLNLAKTICTNNPCAPMLPSSLFFEAFLGIGTYFGCPGCCTTTSAAPPTFLIQACLGLPECRGD